MKHQQFSLQPFPSLSPPPHLQLRGTISRQSHRLSLHYQLFGHLAEVAIAPPAATPVRKHELWRETCFEFFLAIPDAPPYWEFNFSPSGDWNVYCFTDYRQGMQEELAFTSLPFEIKLGADYLFLDLDLDFRCLIPTAQALEMAITTVIKHRNGELTYWGLTHKGNEADFHRRDSFRLLV
jgi:hypothetical protein